MEEIEEDEQKDCTTNINDNDENSQLRKELVIEEMKPRDQASYTIPKFKSPNKKFDFAISGKNYNWGKQGDR